MGGFYALGLSNFSVIAAGGRNGDGNWQTIQPVFEGVKRIELFVGLLTDKPAMEAALVNHPVLNVYLKPNGV